MAKAGTVTTEPSVPTIHMASLGSSGEVVKGATITEADAVIERQAGRDVVVCGLDLSANRQLAGRIEQSANGPWRRCPPHASAGRNSLPHYQPQSRPPTGHTFYETPHRKAQ